MLRDALAVLDDSGVAWAIRESVRLYPAANVVHVLAIAAGRLVGYR